MDFFLASKLHARGEVVPRVVFVAVHHLCRASRPPESGEKGGHGRRERGIKFSYSDFFVFSRQKFVDAKRKISSPPSESTRLKLIKSTHNRLQSIQLQCFSLARGIYSISLSLSLSFSVSIDPPFCAFYSSLSFPSSLSLRLSCAFYLCFFFRLRPSRHHRRRRRRRRRLAHHRYR